jgi:hypothetical protein
MHFIRRYDLKIVFALDRVICGQAIYNVNYGRFCCIRVYIVSYSLDGLQLDVDVLAEEVKKEEQEGGVECKNNLKIISSDKMHDFNVLHCKGVTYVSDNFFYIC